MITSDALFHSDTHFSVTAPGGFQTRLLVGQSPKHLVSHLHLEPNAARNTCPRETRQQSRETLPDQVQLPRQLRRDRQVRLPGRRRRRRICGEAAPAVLPQLQQPQLPGEDGAGHEGVVSRLMGKAAVVTRLQGTGALGMALEGNADDSGVAQKSLRDPAPKDCLPLSGGRPLLLPLRRKSLTR